MGAGIGEAGAAQAGATGDNAPNFDDLVEAMGGPAAKADWTVFVYGHADHSLSYSLIKDMQEMSAAKLDGGAKVNVIVLADFDSSQVLPDSDPEQHYPDGTEVYAIDGNGAEPRLIAKDVELDLDDPAQLERATALVFKAFPAERRGVILWDHGGSWEGGFGHDSQNGTRADSVGMPAELIPPALRAGMVKAGVTAEKPIDLFSFDTCLMGGAEVAYPFRDLTVTYNADAEIDYGDGWDYTATLSDFSARPTAQTTDLARSEVGFWDAQHKMSSTSDIVLRSHIGLDATKLDALASASAVLTQAIVASDQFTATDLARIAHDAAPTYSTTFEEGASSPGLHDFGQVLDALTTTEGVPADIVDAATKARAALADATLASAQGSLRASKKQAGLHIELSSGADLNPEKLASYRDRASQWTKAAGWDGILKLLDDGADQVPPEAVHAVANATEAGPSAIPTLTFSSPSTDVMQGRVLLATPGSSGAIVLRGIIGQGDVAPKTDYEFPWDGKAVTVAGQPAVLANWLDAGGDDADNAIVKIPGVMKDGDEEVPAALVFGNADEKATYMVSVYNGSAISQTLKAIHTASPTATFTPILPSINLTTGEETDLHGTPIAIPESGELTVSLESVPAGDYILLTQLFDVWGNKTTVQDSVTLSQAFGK